MTCSTMRIILERSWNSTTHVSLLVPLIWMILVPPHGTENSLNPTICWEPTWQHFPATSNRSCCHPKTGYGDFPKCPEHIFGMQGGCSGMRNLAPPNSTHRHSSVPLPALGHHSTVHMCTSFGEVRRVNNLFFYRGYSFSPPPPCHICWHFPLLFWGGE